MSRLLPRLTRALRADDWELLEADAINSVTLEEIRTVDNLVRAAFLSFRDFRVFKQTWRSWVQASRVEYLSQAFSDPRSGKPMLGLYNSSDPAWRNHLTALVQLLEAGRLDEPRTLAEQVARLMDAVPEPELGDDWSIDSEMPCVIPVKGLNPWFQDLCAGSGLLAQSIDGGARSDNQACREAASRWVEQSYRQSRLNDGAFHRDVDFVREQQFYAQHPGNR